MLNYFIAIAAGLVCGVLSGFGIGGGTLLMVWMSALVSLISGVQYFSQLKDDIFESK